jgi:3-oxoacyl-[acyl-carrier protein] reductase
VATSFEPPANPFDLHGRRALVTGAAQGIGRQTAVRLAQAGAEVWCVDVNEAGAATTAAHLEAAGGKSTPIGLDVTDGERVREVIGNLPPLHVLCNVAGILTHAPAETLTEAGLDRVLAVNFKGPLFCAQAAFPGMRAEGRGSIVNLASGAIDSVAPNLAAYAISKAAIAQVTKNLAIEWAPHGIRVNAVAPGFVDTSMTTHSYRDAEGNIDEEKRASYLTSMRAIAPLGITGEADDIANTIWFLAADASRFMTGQILRPNGGMAMPW